MEQAILYDPEQLTDYNAIAERYDVLEKKDVTLWQLGYMNLRKRMGPVRGRSILDYGCGSGTFSRYLHESGAMVTGADISETMINVASDAYQDHIPYHHISSGELGFLPDQSFDLAVLNFILCTISTRDELLNILRAIHRVLNNDGSILIMNSNWDKSNGKEFISFKLAYCDHLLSGHPVTAVIKTEPPIDLTDYYWSQEDYCDLLKSAGFINFDIDEPLATGNSFPWLAEKSHPPYYIIGAKKKD